jgi:hypothetical protein
VRLLLCGCRCRLLLCGCGQLCELLGLLDHG